MDKPWFKLDPNNLLDRWWLYTSITDTKIASQPKSNDDIICFLVIQDHNIGGDFYRISKWYKNDPNRYVIKVNNLNWIFDKRLVDMKEGEIVTRFPYKFQVYNSKFCDANQKKYLKILERIE